MPWLHAHLHAERLSCARLCTACLRSSLLVLDGLGQVRQGFSCRLDCLAACRLRLRPCPGLALGVQQGIASGETPTASWPRTLPWMQTRPSGRSSR